MLVEIILELVKNGCKNINVEARKKLQHRTLEAIKCHRRQKEYKKNSSVTPGHEVSDFAGNENFADPKNGVPVVVIPPQQDNVECVQIAEAKWKLSSHEKK